MSLSLPDLDSHLFKYADIIRDAVDPTDYKEFILPLVYYKAISNEYEKQYAENVEEYNEDLARRTTSMRYLLFLRAIYGRMFTPSDEVAYDNEPPQTARWSAQARPQSGK